jgi:hypothetical protein
MAARLPPSPSKGLVCHAAMRFVAAITTAALVGLRIRVEGSRVARPITVVTAIVASVLVAESRVRRCVGH